MGLDEDEKKVLKQYYFFFQDHYRTQIYTKTREIILASAWWGNDYHLSFIKRLEKSLKEYNGVMVKANSLTTEYTGIEDYKVSMSGAGLNNFVCDFICLELKRDSETEV